MQEQIAAYPQMRDLQLGTIQSIADNLNNGYTAASKSAVDAAMAERGNIDASASRVGEQAANVAGVAPQIGAQAVNLGALGGQLQGYGQNQLANAGPNSLEQNFYNQANSDLALGSQLNPEEERAASQQATAAWSARGLGMGSSAGAADLLNRYQLGQARLQQRQGAASSADNLLNSNVIARQGVGLNALNQSASAYQGAGNLYNAQAGAYGTAGSLFGTQGNLHNQSANVALGASQAYLAADPYARAVQPGMQLGNSAFGQVSNIYQNANDLSSNVASYNNNQQASQYNSYYNNQAALQGARSSANGQLMGAGIGAAATIGVGAAVLI